jgi:hypothetical protein
MNSLRTFLRLTLAVVLSCHWVATAKIQFDVNPGYGDGFARAGGWYPIAFEIFNDGPSFDATVEVTVGQFGGTAIRKAVELPTNTRKVFTLPIFCTSSGFLQIDAILRDASGKVRDEQTGKRLRVVQWETPLLGALPGTFAGMPSFPEEQERNSEWRPAVARIEPLYFPDNPISLEGLNSIYLNTTAALKLKDPQVDALLSWLHGGGQLIVAIDQSIDLNALPWLKGVLPATLGQDTSRRIGKSLDGWVLDGNMAGDHGYAAPIPKVIRKPNQNLTGSNPYLELTADTAFHGQDAQILQLNPTTGNVILPFTAKNESLPLIVTGPRGRGQVTLLAFNPEREPFKSWKSRAWFWARLCDVPAALLGKQEFSIFGGRSIDAIFGSMVETRQVQKLPIGFLLVLLVVYLIVIGPLDHWWLKKINRPMLTWITFPTYVALFSLLIYFIGYYLRAGILEWNELHVVDVLPQGEPGRAALRGRSYASLYSPSNERYKLNLNVPHGAYRGEMQGLWGNGSGGTGKATVTQKPVGIEAEVYVPIWSSELSVIDWQDYADTPLGASLEGRGASGSLTISNFTAHAISQAWLISEGGHIRHFEGIGPNATRSFPLTSSWSSLQDEVQSQNSLFQQAATRREETFGDNTATHLDDWPKATAAASFASMLHLGNGDSRDYIWTAGQDLSPLLKRGDALLLAWIPDASLLPPLNQFTPRRSKSGTLLRLIVPARIP